MDSRSFHAHARAYGINTVVVAFHSDLGAFSRDAGHGADVDETVVDFRHFKFEEGTEELLRGAAHCDLGIVVLVVDIGDDCTHHFALAEKVAGDGFAFGQDQLVLVLVEQQDLLAPCLIDFGRDQLAFDFFEFCVDSFFLQVKYLGLESLAQVEDGTASEVGENDLLGVLFADFCFGVVVGPCVAQRDLQVGVGHFSVGHHFQVLEYLHVALVGVHDHVEVLVRAEHFGQHVAEGFFQHANHRGFVDVFVFLELIEPLNHVGGIRFFCHFGL